MFQNRLTKQDPLTEAKQCVEQSEKEIQALLVECFRLVKAYRAAILGIKSRELTEQLAIGKAIDELEAMQIADESRPETKTF